MTWLLYTAIVLIFVFSSAIFIGAPFLPTLHAQTTEALDLLNLKPGQRLLELGSGDGRILREAASRGIFVIGYEINPLLVVYSKIRNRKYAKLITVVWGNYWKKSLPPADGMYVFLLDRYMSRLDTKIIKEIHQPIKVVSFAFAFPNRTAIRQQKALKLYEFKPSSKSKASGSLRRQGNQLP